MMVPLLPGSVLAVALPPPGLVFVAHEFVKFVVVALPFPFLIFPSVILLISLSAAVLLSLLLVALRLTSSGVIGDCTELLRVIN